MVHYQTTDISECPIEELHCSPEQYGFHNACGCGCIDKGALPCNLPPDARVYFIGTDPEQCESADLTCPVGKNAFNNSCGCGCVDQ